MKIYISRIDKHNHEKTIKLLKKIYLQEHNKKFDIKKITYNEYGKPYYDDEFYFNVSHSKNYLAIVISKSNVGIDLEEPRKIYKNFESKILSKYEKTIENNVLNNWVIKEAYTKFLGFGLKIDFTKINAEELLKKNKIYNISNNDYICYVMGTDEIESINIISSKEW